MKSRRLALFVAIALGGGGFLSSAQSVSAADVTGNDVTIDDAHAPSNNAIAPGGGPAFGTAAGFIKEEANSGNVTGNTLTFKNINYTKQLYGGLTFGTGNVTYNRVIVNPATGTFFSNTDGIFGGAANGGGNVEYNHAEFNGDHLNGDLVGGMTKGIGTGIVKDNTALLKSGNANAVYGGIAAAGTNGDVLHNQATIENGHTGIVYGGYADENGNVKDNIVTVKGGIMTGVEGGHSDGTGEVSGNTVNLGDGTSAMAAGYAINGTIYGGRNDSHPDKVSNNTLNVNTNATAYNIKNFSTINFNYNTHMNTSTPLLTLTDSSKTKIKNLSQIHVNGGLLGSGTLIENANGIDIESYTSKLGRTGEKTETIIDKDGTTKIGYKGYQFKGAHAPQSEGTNTWGGRSILGNTTTANEITLNGNYDDVYGGWTRGTGSTATGADAKNHSKGNTITLEGAASQVYNMNGGFTDAAGGNASDNHAILNAGTVNGNLIGGSAEHGDATKNTVEIKNGTVGNPTYGGSAGNTGKAEENTVTLTGGASDDLHGGFTVGGNAEKNKVFVKGGTARDVYGASSASGTVTGNRVEISGGTAQHVYGASSANGAVTGNMVEIGSGGTAQNVYGGKASHGNATENIVEIKGGTVNQSTYGGEAGGTGKAEGNTVTLTSGTANGDIYGGLAFSGDATKNIVNINGGSVGTHNVYGAWTTSGNATHNTVTIKGNGGTVQEIIGGRSNSGNATHNTVNLGDGTAPFTTGITGTISGGSGMGSGDYLTGNTLNVHGNAGATNIKNFEKINFHFNDHVNKSVAMLRLSDAGGTTIRSLSDLSVNGERGYKGTLIEHTGAGTITLSEGPDRVAKTEGGTKELVLTKSSDSKKITCESYIFKGATTPTTDDGGTYKDIFGGRSILGNTTTENTITVSDAVTYRNAYGGWTSGTGSDAPADKQKNSTLNKIKVSGAANVTGKVYGGFTDVAGGKATGNTVTIEKNINADIIGGKAAAEASGNTVNVTNATVKSVTGGDGATTNNNIVNISGGARVTNNLTGGTAANSTGNTLNVKGKGNKAGAIANIQKMNFDASGLAKDDTMLEVTGAAQTKVNWNTLRASGVAIQKVTLLKNTAGHIGLEGYSGSAKSDITDGNTESNIDVVKDSSNNITGITYQGYQFKDVKTATSDGGNLYGGISKAGNSTRENTITVNSGTHTNVYGGWTSGTGTSAADKGNSYSNTVTVKGSVTVNGTVYGGFTDVTGGKATGNTVTVEKNLNADLVGGKATAEASGNTVNVTNATVKSVTGGDGATTNNNIVNISGATVNGTVKGGTQASGKDNTLNVKGQNSAQSVTGFQKMKFHADTASSGQAMLNLTTGATTLDKNVIDADGSTMNGRVTLLHNDNGINLTGYTNGVLKATIDGNTEKNIDVEKNAAGDKIVKVTYEGSQFADVQNAVEKDLGSGKKNAYGGISRANNATRNNKITLNGTYENVYGGYTSGTSTTAEGEKNNSHDNTVTIAGGMVTGKVYGGYTEAADGKTYNNTVNLNGGNLSNAEISGGNRTIGTEKGNTLNVNTAATVKKIDNFQTVAFKDTSSKLTLTGAGVKFDLASVNAGFDAAAQEQTLVESSNALELADGNAFRSDLSADGTKETNVAARDNNKKIVRYGYTLKNATTATTVGSDTWGGRSAAGNTTTGNALTLTAGAHTNVYGGWTSGTGSKAAADQRGDSTKNRVTVKGAATVSGTVYGGYTDVTGGKATGNTVTVEKTINADIIGGKAAAEASGNTVNVTNAAVKSITGGFGTVTNDNRINLRDAKVTGMVTGGTAANGTGNALNVFYGTKTTEIGDYKGIRNLHFDMEKAPMDGTAHTMLRLTNVGGAKSLSHTHIDLHRDGAAPKLQQGDKITLMENAGGDITVGENLTAKGTDGVTRNYEFALATVGKTLIATVTKTGLSEQAKSFVETRAGASAFLNDGGDYLAGSGMEAAKKEAHAAAQAGSGAYGLWAGMGGGALRHETGSYVDMKGWNLGLGWARENAVQAGTLTFGPFVEYGRGSYDSYLDDGTHGSGKTSFFGAGMMAKLETGSHWIDGSLRVGRTQSDYTGLANYDTSNAYYGVQVGVGKDFHMSETDAVSAYVRYSYTHTAGTSAHLSSGETLDFDAVNSHRLRIGTRYTHGATTLSQFYAGLAWEYEFDGDARATSQGDSAPSPSLKGGSALLELGYRFAPKADSRVSYDLNLTGWQGKRQGITGGLSVKWAF